MMASNERTNNPIITGKSNGPTSHDNASSTGNLPLVDDDDSTDTDSAVGGLSNSSSAQSLNSSLYGHVEENGRTYHKFKQGKYPLPNDETEQERLQIQHTLFGVTFKGKLYLAPIGENPEHVLDIATGTGVWAIEFAEQHPKSNVIGTDLSAIQPLYVPSNLRFEIDDAEDEWIFPHPFNFIHGRALISCFSDPSLVIRSAYNSLAPAGYLELQDLCFPPQYIGAPPTHTAFYKWSLLCTEGAAASGRPWNNALNYKRWMQDIGFEEVVEEKFFWPVNSWARGAYFKEIGGYVLRDLSNGLEGLSLKVLGGLGWKAEEVRMLVEEVRRDLYNTDIHAYLRVNVVYGRKPGGKPKESTSIS
ncbi:hypothetical protein EAF04_006094 [Stromatinia cepivora]|nr:hypothetical protein EAF04_006094 [Stromatinia cepivora]